MKKYIFRIFYAALFLTLFALSAFAETDIDQQPECKHCGMSRKQYGYSRMLVEYKNGTKVGTCSLHCVATELASSKNSDLVSFKVADRNSQKLIDAKKAFWVIGGEKRGVMTSVPKWAFEKKGDAQKFITDHGGKPATWEEVLKEAMKEVNS